MDCFENLVIGYSADLVDEYCVNIVDEYCVNIVAEYCADIVAEYCADLVAEYCADLVAQFILADYFLPSTMSPRQPPCVDPTTQPAPANTPLALCSVK